MSIFAAMRSKICFITLISLSMVVSANAADPIPARIFPVKGMEAVESLELNCDGIVDDLEAPASYLYPEWSNAYAHRYGDVFFPDTVAISMNRYCMPTTSTKINDTFGYRPRRRRVHYGIDLKVQTGDTIRAAFDGRVRISEYQRSGYGHYLIIRHSNGLETCYAHLSKKLVQENEIVHAGDPIALGGNTGRSTGSHLHFETRILGEAINPALLFDFPNQRAVTGTYVYYKDKQPKYYKVKSGDTLSRIALRNETSVSALCKLNGMTQKSILHVGQTLRIN